MFMHIVMRVLGQVTALFTTVYLRLTTCLLNSAKRLHVRITQTYLSALIRLHRLVQIVSSFNHLHANLIIAVPLIKAGLITAKAKLIQIGQQLATTAHLTLRRVKALFKKGN